MATHTATGSQNTIAVLSALLLSFLTPQTFAGFEYGIMAGEVESDSVLIWSRTGSTDPVIIRYGLSETTLNQTSAVINPLAANDYTFQSELTNLTASTVYHYQVVINPGGTEELSDIGKFKTAPDDHVYGPVRLGISGDIRGDGGPRFDYLTAQSFDVYLAVGDWPYADAATDQATYWDEHKKARDSSTTHGFMASTSISATWDDHEFFNNVSGITTPPSARVQAAIKAMHDYFPFRYTGTNDIYRSFKYGAGIEVFMLDTRRHRDSNNAPNDTSKTMLGLTQRAWLFNALSASTADFKLIVTSVPLDHGTTGNDHWIGFLHERQLIRDHIINHKIGGALFLATDQHWLSVNQYPDGIREYITGPLTAGVRNPPAVPAYVRSQVAVDNYGVLEYTPATENTQATLKLEARNFNDDSLVYTETMNAGCGELQLNMVNDPQASWTITGDYYREGSGTTHLPYLSPGDYTISFTYGTTPAVIDPIDFTITDGQVTNLTPVVSSESGISIIGSDDFSSSTAADYDTVDQGTVSAPSDWEISGGQLLQRSNIYDENGSSDGYPIEKLGSMFIRKGNIGCDGTYSANVSTTDNDALGMVICYQDENNYYRASFDEQRSYARIVKVVGGVFTELAFDGGYLPNFDDSPVMRFEKNGDQLQLFLRNALVLTATDATFHGGRYGFYTWGSTVVTFDNLYYYRDDLSVSIDHVERQGSQLILDVESSGDLALTLKTSQTLQEDIWQTVDSEDYSTAPHGIYTRYTINLPAGETRRFYRIEGVFDCSE